MPNRLDNDRADARGRARCAAPSVEAPAAAAASRGGALAGGGALHPRRHFHDSLPWHELLQLRVDAFHPMLLASRFLTPLLCVTAFTVVEL